MLKILNLIIDKGLLQKNEIDIYLNAEPDYLHEEWLKRTIPFSSEQVIATHPILKKDNINYFDLTDNFENFHLDFLISYAFTLLFFTLICLSLSRIDLKVNEAFIRGGFVLKFRKLYKNFLKMDKSSFKLIFLFFTFFIWFTNLLLQGNFKVSKVLVSTLSSSDSFCHN